MRLVFKNKEALKEVVSGFIEEGVAFRVSKKYFVEIDRFVEFDRFVEIDREETVYYYLEIEENKENKKNE